jgi:hypothetical protein
VTNKLTQLGVFVVCVVAFVVLAVRGQDTAAFVTFVGPVLAGLFVAAKVNERSDAQDAVLAKISEQTNGVLTRRIRDAVAAALDERNGTANEPANDDVIVRGVD